MLDSLLSGPFVPFTLSLALLFGLLALEVILLLLGASLIGDGAEVELDMVDGPDLDLDIDLDGFDLDPGEFELSVDEFEVDADSADAGASAATSPLGWLGLGKMPTLIWLATVFMSFGVAGIALQGVISAAFGGPLPALLAAVPSAIAAIWFTGRFGALFARALPKTETQVVSDRSLGRRRVF